MESISLTNNGNAIDFRPAGPKPKTATCTIPEWMRGIGKRAFNSKLTADRTLLELISSAAFIASLEQASFGANDKEIKEAVRSYISTWLLPPLVRAAEIVKSES